METLGDRLATERRKAGKSVVDVESGTHIRAGLIEALESGDYDRLPSAAYVRGYLQSIAKLLEIPVEPLLKLYEEETGRHVAPANPVAELPADQVVPHREHAHGLPMRTAAAIAALVAVVALVAWGVTRLVSGPDEPPPVPPQTSKASEATSTGEASQKAVTGDPEAATKESEPATETLTEDSGGPFKLVVKVDADGASWLIIRVDGDQVHAGTIRDGKSLTYEVAEEAVISQIGKPGSVTITRDGEPVEIPDSSEPPVVTLRAGDRDG